VTYGTVPVLQRRERESRAIVEMQIEFVYSTRSEATDALTPPLIAAPPPPPLSAGPGPAASPRGERERLVFGISKRNLLIKSKKLLNH